MDEILRYTNNGYGIVGLLAYSIAMLIYLGESGRLEISPNYHPLAQSVVLALARLENYINLTAI